MATYGIRAPIPSYATLPQADEERIAYSPRPGFDSYRGTLVRRWRKESLALYDQEENAELPIYDRDDVLEGRLSLFVSKDEASVERTIFSRDLKLWEAPTDKRGSKARCPGTLAFSFAFPSTYLVRSGEELWRNQLPPSYRAVFLGLTTMSAICTYHLTLSVTRAYDCKIWTWKNTTTHTLSLEYRPKTYTIDPLPNVALDSRPAFKYDPNSWLQLSNTIKPIEADTARPVECTLFLPNAKSFAITDQIPFHVQLSGPLSSMQKLVPLGGGGDRRPQRKRFSLRTADPALLEISIMRDVSVDVNGEQTVRSQAIGSGRCRQLPPTYDCQEGDSVSDPLVAIDWDGQISCGEEVTSGGFNTHDLVVKDFIQLQITPGTSGAKLFTPLQVTHPIKLVTNAWRELHPADR
ncbi:hypothetical protein AMATHDRAFT_143937 [Amanita thiersii Skay4041]|uniref:Arrestin-like N-terminal domain-containing protein n=1 Tax=Amanita thiersii Skay4041 TaxID=703135 RepID=A0A2A9NT81_9AGAR|nr:hypothetical protein AMATHDRAFT_143937 [Amanita thiersii Skay4041]